MRLAARMFGGWTGKQQAALGLGLVLLGAILAASPSAAQVPANASARSALPTTDHVSGFTQTDEDSDSFGDPASWGFVDSWHRRFYRATSVGMWQLDTTASLYREEVGVRGRHDQYLQIYRSLSTYVQWPAGTGLGDDSAGFQRDWTSTTTGQGSAQVTEIAIVMRAGYVSSVMEFQFVRNQVSESEVRRIAAVQATRSRAIETTAAATPQPRTFTLTSSAATGSVGSQLTLTAKLSGGSSVANVGVTFLVRPTEAGANGDLTLTDVTDANGQATASYVRGAVGRDDVTAFVTAEPSLRATLAMTWSVSAPQPVAAPAGWMVYLPNITKTLGGPAGWQTPFIIQNTGSVPTDMEITYYRFSDGREMFKRNVSQVRPGTSHVEDPNSNSLLSHDSQFSVVVRAPSSPVVVVVNEHGWEGVKSQALSYVGHASGSTEVFLPYVKRALGDGTIGLRHDGWLTTFIVQNLGTATASVRMELLSLDAGSSVTLSRQILPGRSQAIDPASEPALAGQTEYSVKVTSDQPVAVTANAHRFLRGPAMGYSYNGATQTGSRAYLPHVARVPGGMKTRIVIQNVGPENATPAIDLRPLAGGTAVTVRAPRTLRPGQSWLFDPDLDPDGLTPCPSGGTPVCLGQGEYSATISGAPGSEFAAVAWTMDAKSAMGSASASAGRSRLYLPNITRTLGGAIGWTTPILLQSVTATSAQLRWSRFSDGAVMLTQDVSIPLGSGIRIDPRNVAGLNDGTQYAVTVSSSGTFTGLVTELHGWAGDGAMAYEGLAD